MDHYYEYLKRQHYLATHMELTEENVIRVLEELLPYIEADGGWLEFVEIEHETNFVKVRLGGACSTCAMKIVSGTVDQEEQSFLDEEQMEEGFFMSCVSYPTSDLVVRIGVEEELY